MREGGGEAQEGPESLVEGGTPDAELVHVSTGPCLRGVLSLSSMQQRGTKKHPHHLSHETSGTAHDDSFTPTLFAGLILA